MSSASAVSLIRRIQQACQLLVLLQITSYHWPQQTVVEDGATFDYIVVGGGTAGCVVAARLAEDKKTRVLLIEAGGDPPLESTVPNLMIYLEKSHVDWGYTTHSDCYTQCTQNQVTDLFLGKMLGGTSSLSFLLFSEGSHRDYNLWAKIVDDETWSWTGVKHYFEKAFKLQETPGLKDTNELVYGNQGLLTVTKDSREVLSDTPYLNAFQETGNELVTFVGPVKTTGYTTATYTIGDGVRQSTAYSHLRLVKDYLNLFVLKYTIAKRILFDDDKKAVGVEIVTEDGRTMKIKSLKEVIISAGTINSPKLLMLSGIGPKTHLKRKKINVISDLPVGQNLQDQVATIVIHNITKIQGLTKDHPVQSPYRDPRKYPAHVIVGSVNLNKTEDYPTYNTISYANYAQYLIQYCAFTYGLDSKICDAIFAHSNKNQMLFSTVANHQPKSRGKILLQSADYKDAPLVQTGSYSKQEDLENQVKYIKDFIRITNTTSFKNVGGELVDPKLTSCAGYVFGSTEYWRCYALCMMMQKKHYVGTNAMGSVVDARLRVKGVQNLRVVDASVIPVTTSGDTIAPTVVIGEKAADIIKEDNDMKNCSYH